MPAIELSKRFLVSPLPRLHHAQVVGNFAQGNHAFKRLECSLGGGNMAEKELAYAGHEESFRVAVIIRENFRKPLVCLSVILLAEIKFP